MLERNPFHEEGRFYFEVSENARVSSGEIGPRYKPGGRRPVCRLGKVSQRLVTHACTQTHKHMLRTHTLTDRSLTHTHTLANTHTQTQINAQATLGCSLGAHV